MDRPTVLSSLDLTTAVEARRILSRKANLVEVTDDRDTVLAAIGSADIYIASAAVRLDQEFFDHAVQLRYVASPHTGTDHLDFNAARKNAVEVATITNEIDLLRSFTATAEHTFGLLLSVLRHIGPAAEAAKRGEWARSRYTGIQLYGKNFGVLGLGRLGTMAATIAQGFGMKVLACDLEPRAMAGVKMVSIEHLFEQADVVSVHIHLNEKTRKLIGSDLLSRMKPTSVLINTSRGGIIDETALLEGLKRSRPGAAGLDVIDGEWLDRDDLANHPLIAFARDNDRLLVTPHIGGSTVESIAGARVFMAKKIVDYLKENA